MRKLLIAAALLLTTVAMAQNPPTETPAKGMAQSKHEVKAAAQLQWTPMALPGCELAAVSGDPSQAGAAFTIRIKCAAGTVIPAHWHPAAENVTILKGALAVGMGDRFDAAKLTATLNVGDFISIPAEMRHFARANGETVMQVHGTGPFAVNWVNPANVPKAAAGKSR